MRQFTRATLLALLAGTGCSAEDPTASEPSSECSRFVTQVVAHEFGPGQDDGQEAFPGPLLGPPKGAGCCDGSLDVVSFGNGGSMTLEFGSEIVDGPGPDFIVFENAFWVGGNESQPFAELATVSVSEDGTSFVEFSCTATAAPFGSCAGWRPVFANADDNAIDPLDPGAAGGDAFDLAEIGVGRARWVRIVDRPDQKGMAGVFDLDAVAVIHSDCP